MLAIPRFAKLLCSLLTVQVDKPVMMAALKSAIELGYRHIDTAFAYNTEPMVGETLNDFVRRKLISRDDMFITTKVYLQLHHCCCNIIS